MVTRFILVLFLLLSATYAEMPGTSGALMMVRCDNGDDELLESPTQIDLSGLSAGFQAGQDTVIMVHGFNTDFSGAKSNFNEAVKLLNIGNINHVGFYWPSDTLPDFGEAVDNANKTGRYLVYVVEQISKWYGSNPRRIHIISHSLGGRVLLSTMKEAFGKSSLKWGCCFSMAAAVNTNVYFTSFAKTNQPPLKTWVYYSANDGVLKYLYAMYSWLFDFAPPESREYQNWQAMSLEEKLAHMRKIDEQAQNGVRPANEFDEMLLVQIERADDEAMGLIGAKVGNPVTITKVHNVNMTQFVDGHSYWNNGEVMKRIAQEIKTTQTLEVQE